jgi:perosamine synthetase
MMSMTPEQSSSPKVPDPSSHQPIAIAAPFIGEEERTAVMAVLESGMLVQGPVTKELECEWAGVVGSGDAIAVNSGTAALHVALMAHGIGPGDEVITTPFTFIASVNAILMCGATPVFADILPGCFTIDPASVESVITPRTAAILPVHLYGQPASMTELMAIATKHGLVVIEDCAQSIGATYRGQQTGSFGTGAFSLYATKNVMSAEGGMVTTSDGEVGRKSRLLREHGSPRRYHHEILGYNYRISDLHAAIGLAQLHRLDHFSARRQHNASVLSSALTSVQVPSVRADVTHVWHQYTVRIRPEGTLRQGLQRDAAVTALQQNGIGCGVFYPLPAYRQPHLANVAASSGGIAAVP